MGPRGPRPRDMLPRTLALWSFVVLAGCGARLPSIPPPTSAASLSMRVARPPTVAASLLVDPPLPGEPTVGWEGLEAPAGSAPAHVHHHAHVPATHVESEERTSPPTSITVLTVDDAVRRALAENRRLRAAIRELGVDEGRALGASLLPNPTAEIDVRQPDDPSLPVQLDFYVEMPLTESLLAPLRTEAAHRDLDAARHRLAAEVIRTGYDARVAFYRAQGAERRWRVGMRTLEAFAAARDAAEMLGASGGVPELAVAAHVAAYEEARLSLATLALARTEAREALHRALGASGASSEVPLALEPEPVPDASSDADVEARVIAHSLELAELRMRAEAAAVRVDLAYVSGWAPDVSLDVHAEADGLGWEVGGGASFTLPFFDHGEGEGRIASATRDALLERHEASAIELRSLARATYATLETARLRARHYEDVVVPAWARVVEQTRLQYDAMQLGVFELLAALRARLAAELEAARATEDYLVARAAMDALLRGARIDGPGLSAGPSPASPTPGGH